MKSIHSKPAPIRIGHAILSFSLLSWREPKKVASFTKAWLRFPLEHSASQVVSGTPDMSFAELFPEYPLQEECVSSRSLDRHMWNVRLDEEIYLGLIIKAIQARRIFEIGTFNGATTRHMAETAGPDAQVFTLDLPEAEFDRTQTPDSFQGAGVGEKFRNSPVEQQITQLLGDSTHFDFSPYERSMDLVFVDAAHDYVHGVVDSRNALRLVRPGGVVVWHDFGWPGLAQAIREATIGYPLARLSRTTLAVVRTIE